MRVPTEEIAVYPVGSFDARITSFWMGDLENVLRSYPWLEIPHKQAFYMLLCVDEGAGTVKIDQQTFHADPPMILCIRPNSVFSLNINSKACGSVICFTESFFSLRYNNNVLHHFSFLKKGTGNRIRLTKGQWEKWRFLLLLMQDEYRQGLESSEKVLRSYLNVLLFDMDRAHYPSKSVAGGGKEEKLIRFEQLVEEHYHRHKNPSFYARELNITPNYLNKLCRESRGQTSGEIVRDRISLEAQRLLHYTSLSVAEIGYQLGFETPSYFITFFKKQTDSTPESFRKYH